MSFSFGVLFDMDGVLVDSNPVHKKAIQMFCARHGKELTESFLQEHIYGRTNKEWIPALFDGITAEETDALGDEKEELFRSIFSPRDAVIKGLLPFLNSLRDEQIPMAVATSAPMENARFILEGLGITDTFNAVLSSSDVEIGKPHPDIYRKAAQRIGMDPAGCVVIEDSIAGMESGLRAGATVIGITSTHSRRELSDCHLVVDSFEELSLSALEDLMGR